MESVVKVVGSIIESFLGPNKSNKLIINNKDTHIVQCSLFMFQHVHLKDPLSHLIEETLYAHHELYGFSTTTLLAMWYFWNNLFKTLIEDGSEIETITEIALKAIEYVISSLHIIEVPMETILSEINNVMSKNNSFSSDFMAAASKNCLPHVKGINVSQNQKSSSKIPQGVLYSSRHFSPFENNVQELELDGNKISVPEDNYGNLMMRDSAKEIHFSKNSVDEIHSIVKSLCHDTHMAKIVSEMWTHQIISTRSTKFSSANIITCPIVMPTSYTKFVHGLVVKTNSSDFSWHNLSNTAVLPNALIINGDITYEYVHLGFAPKASIKCIKSSQQVYISEKELWMKKCFEIMLKLKIGFLFVKGSIDPAILSFCSAHSIFVATKFPWNILKILCEVWKLSPATNLLDCDSKNVLSNIAVEKFEIEPEYMKAGDQYFKISSSDMKNCQTVIICHPSPEVLNLQEHKFWHITSRLSLATEAKSVLPGNGQTEKWCSELLKSMTTHKSSESEIITALADGFLQFSNKVADKAKFNPKICVFFDEIKSKVQAWQSAISLLLMTIQCDSIIINECDKTIINDMRTSEHFVCVL